MEQIIREKQIKETLDAFKHWQLAGGYDYESSYGPDMEYLLGELDRLRNEINQLKVLLDQQHYLIQQQNELLMKCKDALEERMP